MREIEIRIESYSYVDIITHIFFFIQAFTMISFVYYASLSNPLKVNKDSPTIIFDGI